MYMVRTKHTTDMEHSVKHVDFNEELVVHKK